MKHFKGLLFVALGLALCSGCSNKNTSQNTERLVRLATVENLGGKAHSLYPGKTEASETSNVAFRVAGTLAKVNVKVGDKVSAGQVIAEMDDRDYQVQFRAVEAEYQQVKAECERIIALYEDNGTSQNNYDKARYGLEQITQKYNHAKDQVEDCRLKAPFSGYVQNILHESHETVGAGMPIASVFAAKGVDVKIFISSSEYLQRERFETFTATFDVTGNLTYNLKLVSIAKKANVNQLYEVKLLLEDPSAQITPGMTAMVEIGYKADEAQQLFIPNNSFFNEGDATYVFLYDEEAGVVRKTQVVLDKIMKGGATVSSGLNAGQRVVASGVHHLNDGEAVKPSPDASKTNVGGLL